MPQFPTWVGRTRPCLGSPTVKLLWVPAGKFLLPRTKRTPTAANYTCSRQEAETREGKRERAF